AEDGPGLLGFPVRVVGRPEASVTVTTQYATRPAARARTFLARRGPCFSTVLPSFPGPRPLPARCPPHSENPDTQQRRHQRGRLRRVVHRRRRRRRGIAGRRIVIVNGRR